MKVAIFWDGSLGSSSYYVKNGTAYSFKDDKPYMYNHTISPQCFCNTQNWNFLWDTGYFLNLSEWFNNDKKLPDLDLDVIFYANDRHGLRDQYYDEYTVERIREYYPKAKIVGYLKEVYVSTERFPETFDNRIKFLKDCDYIHAEATSTMKELPEFLKIEKLVGKKLNFSNQPINIDYYYEHFYSSEKINGIYAYLPNPMHRRGQTYEFTQYLGNKYNLPIQHKSLQQGQKFDYLNQIDFVNLWRPYLYHINLDPVVHHPGGQIIQVASVGSLNIGGCNESHQVLYPETATCDLKILEEKFDEYIKSPTKVAKDIQYAWEKLNETYSFNTVRKQLEDLYG